MFSSKALTEIPLPVPAKKVPHPVYFGVNPEDPSEFRGKDAMDPPIVINDDYFWLRDDKRENEEVLAYLKEENTYYQAHTKVAENLQKELYDAMLSNLKQTDEDVPYSRGTGGFLYYTRTVEGLSYKLHCRKLAAGGPEEVVLDENAVAEGHTESDISQCLCSSDDRYVAFGVDHSGSETYDIRIKTATTGVAATDGLDVLTTTSGDFVWGGPDGHSLFYTTMDEEHRPHKLWVHELGRPQAEDTLLYTEDDALFWMGVGRCSSGRFLVLSVESKETSEHHLIEIGRDAPALPVLRCVRPREVGVRYSLDHHRNTATCADHLFIVTNRDGCLEGKLMHTTLVAGSDVCSSAWTDVPFDLTGVHLEDVQCFAEHLVVDGRQGGLTAIWTCSYAGASADAEQMACLSVPAWTQLRFEEASYVAHPSRNYQYDARALRLEYTSLVTPRKTLLYDMTRGSFELLHQREVPGYDASLYCTERTLAPSRDGKTMIPVTMVRRKSTKGDGEADRAPAPMLMDSYGSYGCAMDPYFDYKHVALLDRGVVICTPHIRGGNEMGRYWYEVEGKYLSKMNTFFDFIDCARYMVAAGYTTKDQLAIVGRSAGGLLIGATVTLEPELCKAAVAGVPFVDSLTTMCDPTIPLTICEWEGKYTFLHVGVVGFAILCNILHCIALYCRVGQP